MPEPARHIVLEKSKTVRRRYQRSNKRFEFTPSQIARIEREQERERRAKKLQDQEKKRIANKKKKAEKEAKEREERRRNGPDSDALRVPSSQPLLSKFLQRPPKPQPQQPPIIEDNEETEGGDTEPESPEDVETELDEDDYGSDADTVLGDLSIDHTVAIDSTTENNGSTQHNSLYGDGDGEDEFSECSFFYDEDTIREVETVATAQLDTKSTNNHDTPRAEALDDAPQPAEKSSIDPSLGESFLDDTAIFLEEYVHEFDDTDEEFEQELLNLDPA